MVAESGHAFVWELRYGQAPRKVWIWGPPPLDNTRVCLVQAFDKLLLLRAGFTPAVWDGINYDFASGGGFRTISKLDPADLSTNLIASTRSIPIDQDEEIDTMTVDSLIAITHPEDRGILPDMLHRAIHENAPYEIEFGVLASELIWYASVGRLFRDDSSNPTHIMGVSSNVTERKRAEQERIDLELANARQVSNTFAGSQQDNARPLQLRKPADLGGKRMTIHFGHLGIQQN